MVFVPPTSAAASTGRSGANSSRGRPSCCSSTSTSIAQPGRGAQVRILEGYLPDVLAAVDDASLDAIVCNNVIEHLWDPDQTIRELHRILAPGGRLVVNVPSWRGKFFLELAAFRLGVAPREEMDDHKTYYDPHQLWPMLIAAGFLPSHVSCRRHKFGLNTIAGCTKASAPRVIAALAPQDCAANLASRSAKPCGLPIS